MQSAFWLGSIVVAIAGTSGPAAAKGLRGGEARIGISTTLLGFTSLESENSSNEVDTQTIGLAGDSLGLRVGYAASRAFEFGGLLSYYDNTQEDSVSGVEIALSSAQIGAYLGLNHSTPSSALYLEGILAYVSSDLDLGGGSSEGSGIRFGAGAGIKIFVIDHGSLDLGALLFSQTLEFEDGSGTTLDISSSGILITAGISLWLGGNPPPAPEDEQPY